MNVAILDDDLMFCHTLKNNLSKYAFQLQIFTDYQDLIDHISCFEILFLDIEMPGISGIDIVKELTGYQLDVIFVTSHTEMMRQCFHRHVIGFVEKEHLEDIDEILEKVMTRSFLTIQKDKKNVHIPFDQIVFIEYTLRDILICLTNRTQIRLPEKSLTLFAKNLDERFYQINRNIIINLDREMKYSKGTVMLLDQEFQVSRRKQKDLRIRMLERSINRARNI